MSELKTKEREQSVEAFLAGVADDSRRQECRAVLELMRTVTGEEPKMWGSSIVGFGPLCLDSAGYRDPLHDLLSSRRARHLPKVRQDLPLWVLATDRCPSGFAQKAIPRCVLTSSPGDC